MHIDARELANNTVLEGDICIVGAGAAGISIALDWIGKKEKVILLEGGGFEYDDQVQELYAGNSTGLPYYPLKSTRLHYFGGTTGHWAGFCSKLDALDFGVREWVDHSGWPITLQALEPFYPKAHELVQLGPYEWDAAYWMDKKPKFKSLFPENEYLWDKVWKISPPSRFGKLYKDNIVSASNIHLYTYANLTNIRTNEAGTEVTQVTAKNHKGKTYTVKAKHYILACNSLQNARMLLASNEQQQAGLGNQHDVVGRFFMEHIEVKTGELWLNEPNDLAMYMINLEARTEIAVKPEAQKQFGILNGTLALSPLDVANKVIPHNKSWSGDDPRKNLETVQASHEQAEENKILKRFKKNYHIAYGLFTRIESAPNPESRLTLQREKDALGVQKASLSWQLTALDKRSIRKIHELVGTQLGAAGLGRVKLFEFLRDENDDSWSDGTSGGWHHMGTTRMGNDPKKSVVDANCQVHGIGNLYCAGASCFSTSGAVNPTLSLIALSLRLSAFIKGKMT